MSNKLLVDVQVKLGAACDDSQHIRLLLPTVDGRIGVISKFFGRVDGVTEASERKVTP